MTTEFKVGDIVYLKHNVRAKAKILEIWDSARSLGPKRLARLEFTHIPCGTAIYPTDALCHWPEAVGTPDESEMTTFSHAVGYVYYETPIAGIMVASDDETDNYVAFLKAGVKQ